MYLQRRNGVYWFRKATPLDLVDVIGRTDLRCSLRTTRRDVAKRRAGQLLVALEHIYEVLRSEEPLEPAKILLGNFAQDFRNNGAGTPAGFEIASLQLKLAIDTLGAPALPFLNNRDATWVSIDDVEPLLARESASPLGADRAYGEPVT
jgi:hypothetical protein